MVKLKTEHKHRWGRTQVLPAVGEIDISKEGVIEVENEDQAQELHNMKVGFEIVNDNVTTTTTIEVTETTTVLEPLGEKADLVDDLGEVDLSEIKVALEAKTFAQLQDDAKDFPSSEWRSLKKAELVDYLISKL